MIEFRHVTFAYAATPVLHDVCLDVAEGQLALVTGRTGSGKSTLLGLVNGHVPQFTGGTMTGRVVVDGIDTRDARPRDLAAVVGVVGQDPLAGFVTDTVEDELAYGMEQLATPPSVMRTRVEDVLDLLSIAPLRDRHLRTLSGGEQQRVAIASVLAAGARVLVLDEPTSALDPTSAEEVLAALLRLVHDVGITVVAAEHRLERVVEYADTVITLADGRAVQATPRDAMRDGELVPPVVRLGRLLGWQPLPLSIRDARARTADLRRRLSKMSPMDFPTHTAVEVAADAPGLTARGMRVTYGSLRAVDGVDLDLPPGRVTALMGRNGSGKSSLLWALSGAGPCEGGRWSVGPHDLSRAPASLTRRFSRLVPQTASDLLYLSTVEAELRRADHSNGCTAGTCRGILDDLTPGVPDDVHPRDLSAGQQLALVIATQLAGDPAVVLLDEPTRGLDYPAKAALGLALGHLAACGKAICVATHDVEFVAAVADRLVVMAAGQLIAEGATADVLTSSMTFAPQVSKVTHPEPWLTVDQVAAAL